MTSSPRITVDGVVAEIERELRGEGPPPAAVPGASGPDLARVRELQSRFRAEPIGGRLAGLKRIVHWFVASAFDRQGKVIESLLEELAASEAARERLERRLATLEARGARADADERAP